MFQARMAASIILLAGSIAVGPAGAEDPQKLGPSPATDFSPATAAEARHIVENAASAVQKMTSDDGLTDLLMQAKGVFIVPHLLKGGLVVGGRGGVLLTHQDGKWSHPAFFSLGALTLGPQAGGAEGPLVMLLMSDQAVRSFRQDDSFAIDASAGLSIYKYDVVGRAGTGKDDVIVWSDQGGVFAGAAIGASDISIDADKNHACYRQPVDVEASLEGEVENPHLELLQEKLPGGA